MCKVRPVTGTTSITTKVMILTKSISDKSWMISKGTRFDVISFFCGRMHVGRMKVNFILLNGTFFSFFPHISIFGNILRQKIIRYDIKKKINNS